MKQLEIEFFYPLTEQILLDLDFKPCEDYLDQKRKESTYIGYRPDQWGTTGMVLTSSGFISPNLTIDIDNTPITIRTKKQSFIRKMLYKAMGLRLEKN